MVTRILGVLIAAALHLTAPISSLAQSSAKASDVFAMASRSIVTIEASASQGSGVLVDSSGLIVTNLHVLRGKQKATVKLANGDAYDDVEVVDVDPRKDLLIIKIKGFNLPTAEIADSDRVVVGQPMFAIGSPKGLELSISEGIVSAVRDSGDGYRVFQTTAAVSPGSSGGGLFDESAKLVGITTFKVSGGEALNFAVPINYARGMLSAPTRMSLSDLSQTYPADGGVPLVEQSAVGDGPAPLARGYMSGSSFVIFEARPDGTMYATFSDSSGLVYGRATLMWDKSKRAYVGQGTLKTVCGQVDTRVWDAPITQEIHVISPGLIRDRWTQPTRVNCSRGQVNQSVWQELIWYVPSDRN